MSDEILITKEDITQNDINIQLLALLNKSYVMACREGQPYLRIDKSEYKVFLEAMLWLKYCPKIKGLVEIEE